MISVEQALNLINSNSSELGIEVKQLLEGLNQILAETINSSIDMPPFNQSAMDGYAINKHAENKYTLVGEIQAGDHNQYQFKAGEAMRIFTGAPVPENTTFVAQQELVEKINEREIVLKSEFQINQNIRFKGEQIRKGQVALTHGQLINVASIGFLAGLGISEIPIIKKPKIAFLTTGNELVDPNQKLQHGQIYESNSIMLNAALRQYNFTCNQLEKTNDNFENTKHKIELLFKDHDVILISGGISVGDYDFVKKSLEELGVKEIFYKIKQKPGKPIFFGTKSSKYVFALPGNPASSLTCFYIYVLPLLNKLMGKIFEGCQIKNFKLTESFTKTNSLSLFLKGRYHNDEVTILPNQSSAMLNSFAEANCLIYIPEEKMKVEKNENVNVFVF